MSRYVTDPRQTYKCPYCNESARLVGANVVVDSYSNVCHLECFDKEVAYLLPDPVEAMERCIGVEP